MITITVDTDGVSGDFQWLDDAYGSLPDPLTDDVTITFAASTGVRETGNGIRPDNNLAYAGYTLLVEAAEGQEALLTGWDASRYRAENDSGTPMQFNSVNEANEGSGSKFIIRGMQMAGSSGAFVSVTVAGGVQCELQNCRLKNAAQFFETISLPMSAASSVYRFQNCIMGSADNRMGSGIELSSSMHGIIYVDNCAIVNTEVAGIEHKGDAIVYVRNTAFINIKVAGTDIIGVGPFDIDNCAGIDRDGDNSVGPASDDWVNEYAGYVSIDLTQTGTGNLKDAGLDLSGLFTEDMEGDERSAPWDIGPDELSGPSGPAARIISKAYIHGRLTGFIV